MRKPLVAGNWKMHGSRDFTAKLLNELLEALSDERIQNEIAICPPYVYLADASRLLKDSGVRLGAQNVSAEESGAFTGEIAAQMLGEFDVSYVIVGHSERRALYGESDTLVARKFMAAQRVDLTPILCVGETLEEREAGRTLEVVERQLQAVLDAAGIEAFARAVVAYEPVWAIGTGQTATPEQAQDVHAAIRRMLVAKNDTIGNSVRLVYGGSVKASNAAELFAMPDIDGGLIGGASLEAEQFLNICRAARQA